MVLSRVLLAATAALATTACVPEVEDLEGEVYEVCYRGLDARVERISAGSARAALVVDEVDFGTARLEDPRVGLHTLSVVPADGIDDFAFVDAAHVNVANERILELPAARTTLYGESSAPPNLMPHTRGGDLALTLVFEGDVPQTAWRVSIDACFSVDGVSVSL